jgi:transposase-like protein
MKCPKCGNEKIATAKQPNLATYHYCAQCNYEWKEVTRLTLKKLKKDYGITPTEANMI